MVVHILHCLVRSHIILLLVIEIDILMLTTMIRGSSDFFTYCFVDWVSSYFLPIFPKLHLERGLSQLTQQNQVKFCQNWRSHVYSLQAFLEGISSAIVNTFFCCLQVVLAEKPLIAEETDLIEPTLLDELICHIASLASVYHKPPSAFVEGRTGLRRALPKVCCASLYHVLNFLFVFHEHIRIQI